MITLNDYLYRGDTVLRILHRYADDLRAEAVRSHCPIDMLHGNFLVQMSELLEHNDFLTSQSQRIREFYKYMAGKYPYLAFTFKGRIKSLLRAEEKYNGYIAEFIAEHYRRTGTFPSVPEIKNRLASFHDLIAYRIVIEMPRCHLREGESREAVETRLLYEIADALPEFLEERGFTAEPADVSSSESPLLREGIRPYYRDFVAAPRKSGYQSLHITLYDNIARCYTEVQLRTKAMDDYAEIGAGNHKEYELEQSASRTGQTAVPPGACRWYDEAVERVRLLEGLDLAGVEVSLFTAYDANRVNDGCGLYRGRLILPFEHISRFQNDIID